MYTDYCTHEKNSRPMTNFVVNIAGEGWFSFPFWHGNKKNKIMASGILKKSLKKKSNSGYCPTTLFLQMN